MATSGTYADQANNLAVVSAAFRKIGRLGDFETLADTDQRYLAGLAALKLIVKEYSTIGMPLWAIEELEIPFSNFTTSAGVTIGTAGADVTATPPLKILQAIRRDTTEDIDVEMEIETANDYNLITDKEALGAPQRYTFYPNDSVVVPVVKSTLKVWPLPDTYWDANGAIFIRYQRPLQDVGTSTQDLDFPQEWQRCVVYTLACDLAPEYGIDITQRATLRKERDELFERVTDFGTEEGSFRIQPRKR